MTSSRIAEAMHFAASTMNHIKRNKGVEVPMTAHLAGVAEVAWLYRQAAFTGTDSEMDDLVIAALLHECMEHEEWQSLRPKILELFGADVLAIVDGCVEPEAEGDIKQKKLAYLNHLGQVSDPVAFVLACDELSDLKSLFSAWLRFGNDLWTRIPAGRDITIWYFEGLCRVLARNGSHPLVHELEYYLELFTDQLVQSEGFRQNLIPLQY